MSVTKLHVSVNLSLSGGLVGVRAGGGWGARGHSWEALKADMVALLWAARPAHTTTTTRATPGANASRTRRATATTRGRLCLHAARGAHNTRRICCGQCSGSHGPGLSEHCRRRGERSVRRAGATRARQQHNAGHTEPTGEGHNMKRLGGAPPLITGICRTGGHTAATKSSRRRAAAATRRGERAA